MDDSRGGAQPFLVRLHIGTIVTLTILFTALLIGGPPGSPGGANIGLGFALMPITLLGLPWSAGVDALARAAELSGRTPIASTLALCALPGTAAVNLGLHVVLYRWSRRRRGLPAPL